MEGKLVRKENGFEVELDENGQPRYRGSGKDLSYFDDDAFERQKESLGFTSFKKYVESRKDEANPGYPYRYVPHVIEPSAGADRACLAFLCEAYHEDEVPDEKGKPRKRVFMKLHPRLANPVRRGWIPACAGMTARGLFGSDHVNSGFKKPARLVPCQPALNLRSTRFGRHAPLL